MSLKAYGAEGANLTINAIPVEQFGDRDPAITIEDLENRAQLKRGLNGTGLRLDNATRPKRLTVNVMPDSAEARQLIALEKTGADITFEFSQTGTNEKVAGFDGVMETRGQLTRAGKSTVSDEQFVFIFTDSEES